MSYDFGPASRGIGIGIGIIGMGIGLKFLDDTVKDMGKTRGHKSSMSSPAFGMKKYTPKQYGFKQIKWKK